MSIITLFLISLTTLFVTGAIHLLPLKGRAAGGLIAASGATLASLLVLPPLAMLLTGGAAPLSVMLPWMSAQGGAFALRLDALAALFLLPLFLVAPLASWYGKSYMAQHSEQGARQRRLWCFTNILLASMALVFTARNALLFLFAWELMALSSFMLVVHDNQRPVVRQAGRLYLIATHIGTIFLFAFFLIAAARSGTLDFAGWHDLTLGMSPRAAVALFALLVAGFGVKAGIMPLHIWLPEAHPVAPSHISALMSGVMIKSGIYGIMRLLPSLGAPAAWWGWSLLALGLLSGTLGILFALAQRDMKRLLAYSSVENIGIIFIALGVGWIGVANKLPLVATLAFAGALLHLLNHSIFKSLLFMGAGAVARASGSLDINLLGGLLKRMPKSGALMLVGSAAIAALPPLNGFVGEFLIYWALFAAALNGSSAITLAMVLGAGGLALIGGLALACFSKLFGIAFLGEARRPLPGSCGEPPCGMRWPMALLALLCLLIAPAIALLFRALLPAVALLLPDPTFVDAATLLVSEILMPLGLSLLAISLLTLLLLLLRRALYAKRSIASGPTWDCGYAAPNARMQYTAASHSEPLLALFADTLRTRHRFKIAPGLFPASAEKSSDTGDLFSEQLFTPLARLVDRWLSLLKWIQSGRVQLYLLFMIVTLLALLAWGLGVAK